MRYLEEDYFRYLNLTYSLNSIYACAILLFIVYVLYLTTVTPLTDRPTMHHDDQSLQKQKIRAEDVAYAAFHDTVFDVGEELEKYDECAALSGAKLQTALDELDVLKSSIDTAYKILLDAALSPLSSRLRRCKANMESRIAELKNVLISSTAHTSTEQRELCDTPQLDDERKPSQVIVAEQKNAWISTNTAHTGLEQRERYVCANENNSQVIVASTDCDDGDAVETDDVSMSNSIDCDSMQNCQISKNPDPTDALTVGPDKERQIKRDIVSGSITDDVLYTTLNMTMMCIADCSDADTHDLVCERRFASGLKHRWRWKL